MASGAMSAVAELLVYGSKTKRSCHLEQDWCLKEGCLRVFYYVHKMHR